ncbi:hypothetical protein [Cellulosilyticum ruminicola]|uniref:hypothetical protein n=1 Tax=Cellulosilyticum ruminicola TaxID=425254 RepID=UPI0006D1D117|nr:hypothetical protein [Cellulosilyticum ruminicola]
MLIDAMQYLYCELEVQGVSLGFSKGLKEARNEVKRLEITWIYEQATKGISIQNIFKKRGIA